MGIKINVKKYKDNLINNTLYIINENKTIVFREPQNDDSIDIVNVNFVLKSKQVGLFAKEYHPNIAKDVKKADILLMIIDEINKKMAS